MLTIDECEKHGIPFCARWERDEKGKVDPRTKRGVSRGNSKQMKKLLQFNFEGDIMHYIQPVPPKEINLPLERSASRRPVRRKKVGKQAQAKEDVAMESNVEEDSNEENVGDDTSEGNDEDDPSDETTDISSGDGSSEDYKPPASDIESEDTDLEDE